MWEYMHAQQGCVHVGAQSRHFGPAASLQPAECGKNAMMLNVKLSARNTEPGLRKKKKNHSDSNDRVEA